MQESVAFVASEREDLSSNSFVYSLQSIFATQVLPDLQTGSIAKADSSSTRSLSQWSNSVLPFFKDTGRDKWIFSWSLNSICHNRGYIGGLVRLCQPKVTSQCLRCPCVLKEMSFCIFVICKDFQSPGSEQRPLLLRSKVLPLCCFLSFATKCNK